MVGFRHGGADQESLAAEGEWSAVAIDQQSGAHGGGTGACHEAPGDLFNRVAHPIGEAMQPACPPPRRIACRRRTATRASAACNLTNVAHIDAKRGEVIRDTLAAPRPFGRPRSRFGLLRGECYNMDGIPEVAGDDTRDCSQDDDRTRAAR